MYYVYNLKCANGTIYTGCTNNMGDRLPVNLICYTVFGNKYTVYNFEKYLKSGSGRAFLFKHLI